MKYPILTVDRMNHNNQVYPRSVIEAALVKAQEKVKSRCFLVCSGTPPTLLNTVGVVNNLYLEGDVLMAEVEFLAGTSRVGLLIESGYSFKMFPSGSGSVAEDGTVQPDYELESLTCEM